MILFLLLALLLPPPAPSVPVILVHAAGDLADDWTPERAGAAMAAAQEALAWWETATGEPAPRLSGPTPLAVRDLYAYRSWLSGEAPAILIVSRPTDDAPTLAGGHSGFAPGARVVVLERPALGPLAALIAHEWGHARYGLPDLDSDSADIMARGYRTAYAAGRVGCETLALLGAPCQRVTLPLLGGGR